MLVVIALGGNALMRRGQPLDAETQNRNVEAASDAIASIAVQHDVVVTHGNGPQIGLLALQAAAYPSGAGYPLDVLGAETEGMIGYAIERALANRLPERSIATMLTQVEVDRADPAFAQPTKPIGPVYSRADAHRIAAASGWTIVEDGDGFRRAVASPEPLAIREISAIKILVDAGVLVICAGGGGIPVSIGDDGALQGVEAVIDKDLCSARLAVELGADALLILTDVPAVYDHWGTPEQHAIKCATPQRLAQVTFEKGTMAPKVEAACRFVTATGGTAGVGDLTSAQALLRGESGTASTVGDLKFGPSGATNNKRRGARPQVRTIPNIRNRRSALA
jgi:carbamate kinase